jgi:hypothetical protein
LTASIKPGANKQTNKPLQLNSQRKENERGRQKKKKKPQTSKDINSKNKVNFPDITINKQKSATETLTF